MFKPILFIILLTASLSVINAQDVESYLKQVAENNPELTAVGKLLEAKKYEARTGLTPPDPSVMYGYMPGNTSAIGVKKIWSVNQSFSLPSKYLTQKKVNQNTVGLAEQEYNLEKLTILLEAEFTLFDLIYQEKNLNMLMLRKTGYTELQSAWKKMLDAGEATSIDYNKIAMELSSLNLKIVRAESEIVMLETRLGFLNGGTLPLPENLDFPEFEDPDIDILIAEKSATHPLFKIPEQEYELAIAEYRLSKTGSLPEFQVGYNAEIIPGETYSGPVAGMTIPLWSNSNRIKTASANAEYSQAVLDAGLLKLKTAVLNNFTGSNALKKSIDDIASLLETGESRRLLNLALSNGEISITTYFSDLEVIYQLEDRLLELELEYNKSVAKLYDHRLLSIN